MGGSSSDGKIDWPPRKDDAPYSAGSAESAQSNAEVVRNLELGETDPEYLVTRRAA